MTNAGESPHVMKRPHHGLSAPENFCNAFKRKETLIYPVQMNYVGFLEVFHPGYVYSEIRSINFKKSVLAKAVRFPYCKSFAKEIVFHPARIAWLRHGNCFRFFTAHQHGSLDAVVAQSLAQPRSSYCRTAGML